MQKIARTIGAVFVLLWLGSSLSAAENPVLEYNFGQENAGRTGYLTGSASMIGEPIWEKDGLRFNGSNCLKIDQPKWADFGGGGFTVEVVAKLDRLPSADAKVKFLARCRYAAPAGSDWALYIAADGTVWFNARNSRGSYVGVKSLKPVPLNQTVQLVGSRNPQGLVFLYVDGQPQGVAPGADMSYKDATEFTLGGGMGYSRSTWFEGTVEKMSILPRALSGPDDAIIKRSAADSPSALLPNKYGLRLLDREVHYPISGPVTAFRPVPMPESALAPRVPPAPRTISPYPWKEPENVVFGSGRSLSANIYREPGTSRVLQLGYICPGQDDTRTSGTTKTWYRVSQDGGKTFGDLEPVIQQGKEYDLVHPLDGVWVDKNPYNIDYTRPIVRASNGEIMVPVTSSLLGKDGLPENPRQAYGYSYAGILIGKWNKDGGDLTWDYGRVGIDAELSSRGLAEPTIIELKKKGSFMMVARGSNDWAIEKYEAFPNGRYKYTWAASWKDRDPGYKVPPGYKWVSFSRDYCRTWSKPAPFTYSDGANFFSPSACSTLIRSSKNGRIYWVGNICPENSAGNDPRYPLVIGQVDEKTCGLIKESVLVLDTLNPAYDTPKVQLSNFHIYEDPETGNIAVDLDRIDQAGPDQAYRKGFCWYLVGVPAE